MLNIDFFDVEGMTLDVCVFVEAAVCGRKANGGELVDYASLTAQQMQNLAARACTIRQIRREADERRLNRTIASLDTGLYPFGEGWLLWAMTHGKCPPVFAGEHIFSMLSVVLARNGFSSNEVAATIASYRDAIIASGGRCDISDASSRLEAAECYLAGVDDEEDVKVWMTTINAGRVTGGAVVQFTNDNASAKVTGLRGTFGARSCDAFEFLSAWSKSRTRVAAA